MRDVTFEYSKLMPVLAEQDKSKMIKAPMPGVIRSIFCKVGEFVRPTSFFTFLKILNSN